MKHSIAHRRLRFSKKGDEARSELTIYIGIPRFVPPSSLPFESDSEMAVCDIEIIGLEEPYVQSMIGIDLLQAIQQAADVDPILKGFSGIYDFFYEDGEPYFKSE